MRQGFIVVASATKGACQESCSYLMPRDSRSQKRSVLSGIKIHHHVVSLVVIVMCLMLKCMETSKVEIQAHTLVWSVSFLVFLVLVMFTFCGHFVIPFDSLALIHLDVLSQATSDGCKTFLCLLSRKPLWICFFELAWGCGIENAGDVGEFSVVSVSQETKHKKTLKRFGETSEQDSGRKIEKMREHSF